MTPTKKILFQMPGATYSKVNSLVDMTNIKNKTRLIISAIDIAFEIVSHIKKGGKVFLEDNDNKKEISLIGL